VSGRIGVDFWGFTDKHSWIKDNLHLDDEPLSFDMDYRSKAAFFGVRDALLGPWVADALRCVTLDALGIPTCVATRQHLAGSLANPQSLSSFVAGDSIPTPLRRKSVTKRDARLR
jgi:hypothetical protein